MGAQRSEQSLGARFVARIEYCMEIKGLDCPWWDPVISSVGIIIATVVAVAQRGGFTPPGPLLAPALLIVLTTACRFLVPMHRWLARNFWVVDAVPGLIGTVWILSVRPDLSSSGYDFAPAILAFLAAELVSREGWRFGLAFTLVSTAVVIGAAVAGTISSLGVHLLMLGLGYAVGAILLTQMSALRAERLARLRERERATLAERARIAREIHDLVGHSLSVTLLHLTGARRAIADGDDPAEIVSALRDAEDIGRRAMAEIRRTASTLADGHNGLAPLPSLRDLEALVGEVRSAGHPVTLEISGRVDALDAGVGLGLYRITQESLSNAIRHAPGEPAAVRVEVGDELLRLSVRNPRDAGAAVGEGAGLLGMAARAEQLGGRLLAGPDGPDWAVELTLPLAARRPVAVAS